MFFDQANYDFVCNLDLTNSLGVVRGIGQKFDSWSQYKLNHLLTSNNWSLVRGYGLMNPKSTYDVALDKVNHNILADIHQRNCFDPFSKVVDAR